MYAAVLIPNAATAAVKLSSLIPMPAKPKYTM